MANDGENERRATLAAQHRTRLIALRDDAAALSGTLLRMVQAVNQALDHGGTVSLQSQVAFMTGAHARMLKDLGVIEHLQGIGAQQKKPMK